MIACCNNTDCLRDVIRFSKEINKGIGVDNMHHLNDGLWKVFVNPQDPLDSGIVHCVKRLVVTSPRYLQMKTID